MLDIAGSHDDCIHRTAHIACTDTQNGANQCAKYNRNNGNQEGRSAADTQANQNILTERVRTEDMALKALTEAFRCNQLFREVHLGCAVGRNLGNNGDAQNHNQYDHGADHKVFRTQYSAK